MARPSLIRAAWIVAFIVGTILLASAAGLVLDVPFTFPMVQGLLLGAVVFLLLWLLWKGLQVFLWRVGRRLAFSYLLIGILPIPMVVLLVLLNLYLLGGYFLGHLYRDAASGLHTEILTAAEVHLTSFEVGNRLPADREGELIFAFYRAGGRIGGDSSLPQRWPEWLTTESESPKNSKREPMVSYVAREDGSATMAGSVQRGDHGVLAVYDGTIESELTARSDVWVMLLKAEDPRKEGLIRVQLLGKEFVLQPFTARRSTEGRQEYFGVPPESGKLPWWRRPFIWWGEISGPLRNLQDGTTISEFVTASLNATPAIAFRHLISGSAEVNTAIWASLIAITGVLLSIYVLAIIMAFYMIFTLSRAVNRLSRATEAVRRGEFSVRIPVRRRDQIGELQRSFNEMAASLDSSVVAIAQKEVLEKELEIARDLQQSLLPTDIPTSESVEFATLFDPSAAIGGDYFDILRIDEDRLVVVIADVSGHGLPTGLRMAMLKAALVILVQEGKPPEEIFKRLSAMVRGEQERRFFVTSTLAVIDFRSGKMELTNAGHPPTYLLHHGEVSEIALTGHPLGALGDSYGHQTIQLAYGDIVVWLSDGIIEAVDDSGEPFGYERLQSSLEGEASSASEVRDRLLTAAKAHTSGRPGEDDKTLVAMRYSAAGSAVDAVAAE